MKPSIEECRKCQNVVVWYSLFSNFILVFYKGSLGFITGSSGLIADAFHSLTDVVAGTITLFGLMVSKIPSDENHPYGHGKIQFISSGIVALILFSGAIVIFVMSATNLIKGDMTAPHPVAMAGAIVSIFANEIMFRYQKCVAVSLNSPAIMANAWDDRSDALSSIGVLLGIIGAQFGYPFLDSLAALIVSLLVMKVGLELALEAVNGLMDSSPPVQVIKQIYAFVAKMPDISEIVFIRGRSTGDRLWIEIGVGIDDKLTVMDVDRINELICQRVKSEIDHVGNVVVSCLPFENKKMEKSFFSRFNFLRLGSKKINKKRVVSVGILIFFIQYILAPETVFAADGWGEIENNNEVISNIFSYLALICFLIGNLYTPAKFLMNNVSSVHLTIRKIMADLLEVHIGFNIMAIVFMCFHVYFAEDSNILLFLGSVMIMIGTIEGFLLRFRLKKNTKKRMRLLHTQQALFCLTIFLFVAGHILVD